MIWEEIYDYFVEYFNPNLYPRIFVDRNIATNNFDFRSHKSIIRMNIDFVPCEFYIDETQDLLIKRVEK